MMRTGIIAASVATVVATLIFAAIGVEFAFAVAWGVLGGILMLCTRLAMPNDPRTDAPDIEVARKRRATEISRMAWSLNPSTGMAGQLITRRVRTILAHRLQRRGLDVDDPAHAPAIEALVGAGVWARLIGRGTTRQELERALEAIDRLSPTEENR